MPNTGPYEGRWNRGLTDDRLRVIRDGWVTRGNETQEMAAELLALRARAVEGDADAAPADLVAVPFETVLNVYLDGFGTGAASALAKVKPDAPGALIDQAAAALVDRVKVDPITVEQLREFVRGRLRGEVHNRTVEVRVWGEDG